MTFPRARIAARVAARFVREHRVVFAMSLEEAKEALGFKPEESPSEADIQKAWKNMAFMFHPDRGGDEEVMKEVNVARDVLLGKQRATYSPSSSPSTGSPADYGTYQRTPRQETVVTFDEAKASAGIPSGVDWKMKATTAYGGYGDTSYSGYVVYGQTERLGVFVSVHNYNTANAFSNSSSNIYTVKCREVPLDSLKTARDWAEVFKGMYSRFDGLKRGFNNKVEILPSSYKLDDQYGQVLKTVGLVDAIEMLGLSGAPVEDPLATGRKLVVVFQVGNIDTPYEDQKKPDTLIINGREFALSPESSKLLAAKRVYRLVFGAYYYPESKKDLTKSKDGKKVLEWMSTSFTHEPQALRDMLAAASAQMKK